MKGWGDEAVEIDTRRGELIFARDNYRKGNGIMSFAIFARTLRPQR